MIINRKSIDIIDEWAKFRDEELERAYCEELVRRNKKTAIITILIFGIIFFSISIFDYFFSGNNTVEFFRSTIARVIVVVVAIIVAFVIKKTDSIRVYFGCILFFPFVLVSAYVYLLAQQGAQGFGYQAMAIIVIMFFSTALPGRWFHIVIMDISFALIYLIASRFYIVSATVEDYVIVMIYIFLTILFITVNLYWANVTRRERYVWEKQIKKQSVTDKLTGLYNRTWLDYTLAEWCSDDKEDGAFSIVLMDIDDFKNINDTYGHLVGDDVMREFAELVKSSVRNTDFSVRWGGEEFLVFLPGANGKNAAEIAEKIRINVENFEFTGIKNVTVSLGAVAYKKGETCDSMMHKADKMMYLSKKRGKNRVNLYDYSYEGK